MRAPGLVVTIFTDDWEDNQCPVEAVRSVFLRGQLEIGVVIDREMYPYPEEYVDQIGLYWGCVCHLIVSGMDVPNDVVELASTLAGFHNWE